MAAKGEPWELYDLSKDRAEQNNLAAKMPDKVRELEKTWQKHTDEFTELAKKDAATQAPRPTKKPIRKKASAGK